ncbi:MAG: hypothetical protein A2V70_03615 [Planctomycetes bacterium RBG_13_63_9]|nr:MAG: hypothetical protein A2V70_03615 [Planctomycetes bacterium RBG_13_63_9]
MAATKIAAGGCGSTDVSRPAVAASWGWLRLFFVDWRGGAQERRGHFGDVVDCDLKRELEVGRPMIGGLLGRVFRGLLDGHRGFVDGFRGFIDGFRGLSDGFGRWVFLAWGSWRLGGPFGCFGGIWGERGVGVLYAAAAIEKDCDQQSTQKQGQEGRPERSSSHEIPLGILLV